VVDGVSFDVGEGKIVGLGGRIRLRQDGQLARRSRLLHHRRPRSSGVSIRFKRDDLLSMEFDELPADPGA